MDSILNLIGKFHPLLLHLPIGVLIYAYLHLGYDLLIKKKIKPVDIGFALGVGAISAVMSCISGYLLSTNGEYAGEILDWHKWLGIGTAVGAILLFLWNQKSKRPKGFFMVFTLFMGLLTVTGHYGGSLTHGEGFLYIDDATEKSPLVISDVNNADVFEHLIMPIVDRKCMSCHNPKKAKGDLILNTIEGWKKGGKTGKLLVSGDLDNSLISLRAHLPIEEDEHMPPSGKLQLEKEEIALMDWWISKMTHYTHKVSDLSPPPHIMKYIKTKLDYSTEGVPLLVSDEIKALQAKGIPVQRISEDKPWLSINYTRGQTITKNDIDHILSLNENIREIKMSKVGLTDKLLYRLDEFNNLKTLDISLNDVSSNGISRLKDLKKIESINLYGTNVDKELLRHLHDFASLKSIYLWQTDIDKDDIADAKLPQFLEVNLGQDLSVFGSVKLSSPMISGASDIFVDTIHISLNHQASNAVIRYTTDGTEPRNNSLIYDTSFVLDRTATVRAAASMEGWEISASVDKSYLKSTYKVESCIIDPRPNEKYSAEGNATIIDLQKASNQFGDGKWLGFSAQDVSITLDLGIIDTINVISFGTLRDYRSYIFTPIGAKLSISTDGLSFTEVTSKVIPQITKPEDNLVVNTILDIPRSAARYLKLDMTAQKKNPAWHPSPGADCWLFIDEVVVE